MTPAQFAQIRSDMPANQRGITDAQIQQGVDAKMSAPNPTNQTSWLQVPRARQDMYRDMNPNISSIWDDPNSFRAQQARMAEYAEIRNPNGMRLSNLHREYMGPKEGQPNHGLAGHRFNDNAREGFYQRMGMVLPANYKDTAASAGWDKHPYLDRYVPPAPAAAAPSPAPSPAPAPAPMQTPTPMQAPSPTPPVQPSAPPMGKEGGLTDKQMFKVAFLAKCIEDGLTIDEIKVRVKQALYFAKKEAVEKRALDWSTLGMLPLAAAALGVGGSYWAGNNILGPGLHQVTKPRLPSKEDLLAEELVNEYDKQTENVTREAELTRRRRARDRNISGITRY